MIWRSMWQPSNGRKKKMCQSKIQENAAGKQCQMAFHMSQTHWATLFHIFDELAAPSHARMPHEFTHES